LKEQTFNVCIPFVDNIEVLNYYNNSRIQVLFFGTIRRYAMFNFKQRQISEVVWFVETKEDFFAAKRLFKFITLMSTVYDYDYNYYKLGDFMDILGDSIR
jgi:hypothetical protein